MKRLSHRSGSALLIVLGMLSFMIVSAVGFAAYMRSSRQPSSYLRRSSMTRQMAKAALARAMDTIDRAINNNVHPGLGQTLSSATVNPNQIYNGWEGRVFTGTNRTINVSEDDTDNASPLCLEALAYIPPPLVNEARYYGRHVDSTAWGSLDFDMGRYTWLALDVSDYLDINRLSANLPRKSAGGMRVSLAHLFEDSKHRTAPNSGTLDKWDTFMEKYRGELDEDTLTFKDIGNKEPLLSMADFSLALGHNGDIGDMTSPFYTYINSGGSGGFYGTESDEDEEALRQMTFLTESLMAPVSAKTSDGETIRNLADGQYQPFEAANLETEGTLTPASFFTAVSSVVQEANDWVDRLGTMGCALLFDYLDVDHVPLSLAIPTAERVPMVCGLQPTLGGGQLAIKETVYPEGDATSDDYSLISQSGDKTRKVQKHVAYTIDSAKLANAVVGGSLGALIVYPFSHARENDPDEKTSYTVDGRFTLFLTSEQNMALRTKTDQDYLHLKSTTIESGITDEGVGVMHTKVQMSGSYTVPKTISEQKDAVTRVDMRLTEFAKVATQLALDPENDSSHVLLDVTYEWQQTKQDSDGANAGGVSGMGLTWGPKWSEDILLNPKDYAVEAKCNLKPLGSNGTVDSEFNDPLALVQGNGKDVYLNASAIVRLSDGTQYVDMVPACLFDDNNQNSTSLGPLASGAGGQVAARISGWHYPVMRFGVTGSDGNDVKFTFSVASLHEKANGGADLSIDQTSPKAAIVADPRWNYAPEHWYDCSVDSQMTAESWINRIETDCLGQGNRDGDIFMATSDAGYLQSIYELAFLPRLTDLVTYGDDVLICNTDSLLNANKTSIASTFAGTLNSEFAWRTYDPMGVDEDAFAKFPRANLDNGFRINPYSDSTNVLMAAFANTPIDWNRASTNYVEGEIYSPDTTAAEFNKKYAFNEYSEDTKIAWDDLKEIAQTFREKVEEKRNWVTAWQDLDWSYDEDSFCGVELTEDGNLWSADRKFLYGFWRECFAARQQMFLIFVRAEPSMMGGEGDIPPQLGSRAVALVWRDPTEAKSVDTPHQMRVLMYRQFD